MSREAPARMRVGVSGTPRPVAPRPARHLALVRDLAPPPAAGWRRLAGTALVVFTLGAAVLAALLASMRIE